MSRTIAVAVVGRQVAVQCEVCGNGAVQLRSIPPVWRPLKRRRTWRTLALRVACDYCDKAQAERDHIQGAMNADKMPSGGYL